MITFSLFRTVELNESINLIQFGYHIIQFSLLGVDGVKIVGLGCCFDLHIYATVNDAGVIFGYTDHWSSFQDAFRVIIMIIYILCDSPSSAFRTSKLLARSWMLFLSMQIPTNLKCRKT